MPSHPEDALWTWARRSRPRPGLSPVPGPPGWLSARLPAPLPPRTKRVGSSWLSAPRRAQSALRRAVTKWTEPPPWLERRSPDKYLACDGLPAVILPVNRAVAAVPACAGVGATIRTGCDTATSYPSGRVRNPRPGRYRGDGRGVPRPRYSSRPDRRHQDPAVGGLSRPRPPPPLRIGGPRSLRARPSAHLRAVRHWRADTVGPRVLVSRSPSPHSRALPGDGVPRRRDARGSPRKGPAAASSTRCRLASGSRRRLPPPTGRASSTGISSPPTSC